MQATFMQSVDSSFQAGFQMNLYHYVGQCIFSYCLMYQLISQIGHHQVCFAYNPTLIEPVRLSHVAKLSQRLWLFSELKAGPKSKSDVVFGFKLRFRNGSVTGYINSLLHSYATYQKTVMQDKIQLEFHTQMDLLSCWSAGQKNCCVFGVNINVF